MKIKKGWFTQEIQKIELFSTQNNPRQLLATLEKNENDSEAGPFESFDLLDADRKVVAKANKLGKTARDWLVKITDRNQMQSKNIPNAFLIWMLLKYSQEFFPSPKDCVYINRLPQ